MNPHALRHRILSPARLPFRHSRLPEQHTGNQSFFEASVIAVLTEEYSEHGVHMANVVIDGLIDSPGTRALPMAQKQPRIVMNPVKIAESFYYLHTQDRSCWTHELQLTPFPTKPSF